MKKITIIGILIFSLSGFAKEGGVGNGRLIMAFNLMPLTGKEDIPRPRFKDQVIYNNRILKPSRFLDVPNLDQYYGWEIGSKDIEMTFNSNGKEVASVEMVVMFNYNGVTNSRKGTFLSNITVSPKFIRADPGLVLDISVKDDGKLKFIKNDGQVLIGQMLTIHIRVEGKNFVNYMNKTILVKSDGTTLLF